MTKSISQSEVSIDETVKTAIFYPIPELNHYLVELRHRGSNQFIEKQGNPQQFENIALAKIAAKSAGAVEAYQAIGKTYQEAELTTNRENLAAQPRFDYMKIELN